MPGTEATEDSGPTAALRQRVRLFRQRLFLFPTFNVDPDHGWLPGFQNPCRNQYNPWFIKNAFIQAITEQRLFYQNHFFESFF